LEVEERRSVAEESRIDKGRKETGRTKRYFLLGGGRPCNLDEKSGVIIDGPTRNLIFFIIRYRYRFSCNRSISDSS
jgi:hypothetical protein